MAEFIEKAAANLQNPEVANLVKQLSSYGFGVCVPHMHDEETGEFLPLPEGTVQSESQLQVTFRKRSELTENDLPVAWVWNDSLATIQTCHTCRPDGPHH